MLSDSTPEITGLVGKDHQLLGKRVLSTGGDDLGKVADTEFDPDTGAVTALVLTSGEIAGTHLVGVGSYAVVVHAE
jgi:sporulation protein YlmC with PRC-barrel domain